MQERRFDKWQCEAIELSGGHHLVLAPPGCGKTDILTERIVHAHAEGVEYNDMLCLTFTNRAAKGMAQRIADRTGNPVPDGLFVGNIHRYCSQLLFNEGIVSHNSAIIDEGDVENIIQEELCKRMNVESHTTELMRLQHALWQASLDMPEEVVLHNELLHTSAMQRLCEVLECSCSIQAVADIYSNIENLTKRYTILDELSATKMMLLAKNYQRYKEENDLLDYDDLLVLAYKHLIDINKSTESKKYKWIEIDEVQDLNALQFALIDLLATSDATIVYLGDEQQAIFSFIGAKLETLETLKQRCKSNIHYLHTNYRSPKYLLDLQNDFATRCLGIRREMLPTTDNYASHRPEDLCLLNVGDAQLESYYTARFAHRYGELNPDGRVAILVSTNREADEISEVMTGMGIGHFKISGTDLFSLPTVRLILSHLSVLTDEMVFIAWARLFWGLKVTPSYTAARNLMREMRHVALLPTDFLCHPDSSYLQEFVHAYDNEELVIFDTETTGLDPRTDDIVQIAAIRVKHGRQVGKAFNIILETDKELPEMVGGHPNPMIEVYRNSRRYSRTEGLRLFMDYCNGKVLVGHNVEYDYQILSNNLKRSLPETKLEESCPRYFDTLKYIRLVRPRLRQYKLGHLLEVLHLEGQNSHQADDDILATKSLLDFCHLTAMQMIADQRLFISDHRRQIEKFHDRYSEIYHHAVKQMHTEGTGIVDELQYIYGKIVTNGLATPVDKWRHLIHYLEVDIIRTDLYPTLRTQLDRYITDLCTSKEADMCGSSLEERYIISTVHKAKGLEFDTVIIYRAIDGNYPSSRSWTEKQIQEDARKLFVALSRSKKSLCILYDEYFGRSVHTLSPFLEKVKEHFTLYQRNNGGKIRQI